MIVVWMTLVYSTWYAEMIPFCSSIGGSFHETVRETAESALAVTFCGGSLGAVKKKENYNSTF